MPQRLHPVTGRGILLPNRAAFGSAAGAESFALGILSRHRRDHAQVTPVEAVLRAAATTSVSNLFQLIAMLSVRPALAAQFGSRAVALPPVTRTVERESSRRSRLVFERIFARERRTEAVPAAPSPQAPVADSPSDHVARLSPPESGATRDTMVLRRSPAPPLRHEDRNTQPAALTAPAAGSGRPGSRGAGPVPPPESATRLSSGDLGRLTDEVVRAIDRRIIAQRERRGVI